MGLSDGPAVPAQGRDPFGSHEPVHAGARPDEESIKENGRHRAG